MILQLCLEATAGFNYSIYLKNACNMSTQKNIRNKQSFCTKTKSETVWPVVSEDSVPGPGATCCGMMRWWAVLISGLDPSVGLALFPLNVFEVDPGFESKGLTGKTQPTKLSKLFPPKKRRWSIPEDTKTGFKMLPEFYSQLETKIPCSAVLAMLRQKIPISTLLKQVGFHDRP